MCSGDWCHRSYQIHNRYAPVSQWLCCSHWQELGYIWFLTFCFWIPGMNCKSNWFYSLQFWSIHNSSSCHEICRYILSLMLEVHHVCWRTDSVSVDTLESNWLLLLRVQKDNVSNQREHLILLLSSAQSRLGILSDPGREVDVMKVFSILLTNPPEFMWPCA